MNPTKKFSVNENRRLFPFDALNELQKVVSLHLRGISVGAWNNSNLKIMPSVFVLDISDCSICENMAEIFEKFPNVQVLYINAATLFEAEPKTFQAMSNITHIYIPEPVDKEKLLHLFKKFCAKAILRQKFNNRVEIRFFSNLKVSASTST